MYRLRELRKRRKLNQSEMASAICVSRQAYCTYENGTRQADYETLKKLADYFNVTVDYLLERDFTEQKKSEQQSPDLILKDKFISAFKKANIDIEKVENLTEEQLALIAGVVKNFLDKKDN